MKSINILSTITAYQHLNNTLFRRLLNIHGITNIKDYELDCIHKFIKELSNIKNNNSVFNDYYLSYSIPQIGKEFDLLRFGSNYIINIELKTESTTEAIFSQQQKNKYYLSFLKRESHIFTYVSNENKLYKLISDKYENKIIETTFKDLNELLINQNTETFDDIDNLFCPSNYLISPFNSTKEFIAGKYFLTNQQEEIYKKIRAQLSDKTTNFIAITGKAGTGKTLLTYHIAKETITQNGKVLIIHCAPLNNGHYTLKSEHNWDIYNPKFAPKDITNFDLIIIDEAQRIYPNQLDEYINNVKKLNKKCIFSFDENQYLRNSEKGNTKEKVVTELSCIPYKLTEKIRTNSEIASFIKQLFDINKNIKNTTYKNIEITYCSKNRHVQELLTELSNNNWKVINYTPGIISTFKYEAYRLTDNDECAHSIIGQEFDNVVIVIDDSFKYDKNGKLIADNTFYSQSQMLYQIITRTRKKLHIIVMNNEFMLERCLNIISQNIK